MNIQRLVNTRFSLTGPDGDILGTATITAAEIREGDLHITFSIPDEALESYMSHVVVTGALTVSLGTNP